MWIFFKVFIEFITILFLFYVLFFLATRHVGSWGLPRCSVSRSVISDSLQPHGLQHTRPPCPSPTPGVHPNPCPLSRWCHPTILSHVIPFSSHLQSCPASGSFPMNQFFASGSQSTGASASASVLLMNIKDWFPLGFPRWLTGKIICLQCRRHGFDPWVRMIPWRREWHSSILPWKIPWTENLAGYTPQGHKESDTTEYIDTWTCGVLGPDQRSNLYPALGKAKS